MDLITGLIVKFLVVGSCVGLFFGIRSKFEMRDDSPMEQVLEQVIKQETGLDIDLTPDSPESSQKI